MQVPSIHHPSNSTLRDAFVRWHLWFALALLLLAALSLHAQERAAIHKVAPAYPPIAKQMGITGTVVVTTTVDATGKVIKAESTSGNKLLSASAIDAVKQWKFAAGDSTDTFPVSVNFERN